MDEQTPNPEYLKGFNDGHLMAKHMPDLAAKLSPVMEKTSHGMGFKDGREEFLLEQKRDKYPAWRKNDWMQKSEQPMIEDKSKDLEKEIDDPEPEI